MLSRPRSFSAAFHGLRTNRATRSVLKASYFGSIFLGWAVVIGLLIAGGYYGLTARRWAWESTQTVRFQGDIRNGFRQGNGVVDDARGMAAAQERPVAWRDYYQAYVDAYLLAAPSDTDFVRRYVLDYAPGRLLVMTLWTKSLRERTPPVTSWNGTYALNAPVLTVNTVAEALTAIGMVALVRHWRRAAGGHRWLPSWKAPWRELPAVLAGLAVWFNPALITNAHVWPQWDCWLLPFFVSALVAASKDRWLLAGFLIGCGAVFKGQILLVAPLLLLWPIFAGKFAGAVRFVIGLGLLAALVGLPWMLYMPAARYWLGAALLMMAMCGLIVGLRKRFDPIALVAVALTVTWAVWICVRFGGGWLWAIGGAWAVLAAVLPRWLNRRWLGPAVAAQLALAILFAGLAFGGRFEWFELSYGRPQNQYRALSISADNLPRILGDSYRWGLDSPVQFPGLPVLPMRQFLVVLYGVTLVLCAIGAALHARRRSPRVMIALAAPWVLMFTLVPQMHERYLLWGAVAMCAGFGVSAGMGLLATAISFYATMSMTPGMLRANPSLLPNVWNFINGASPGVAWALLILAAVCLYVAVAPERRRKAVAVAQPVAAAKEAEDLADFSPESQPTTLGMTPSIAV